MMLHIAICLSVKHTRQLSFNKVYGIRDLRMRQGGYGWPVIEEKLMPDAELGLNRARFLMFGKKHLKSGSNSLNCTLLLFALSAHRLLVEVIPKPSEGG